VVEVEGLFCEIERFFLKEFSTMGWCFFGCFRGFVLGWSDKKFWGIGSSHFPSYCPVEGSTNSESQPARSYGNLLLGEGLASFMRNLYSAGEDHGPQNGWQKGISIEQ